MPALLVALTGLLLAALALGPGGTALPGPADAAARVACPGAGEAPKRLSAKEAERLLVCMVNERRRKKGRKHLRRSADLMKAAASHTAKMRHTDCYAHTCPGEPSLAGRLQRAGYLPCGCSWRAGETIAFGKGHKGSPRGVIKSWMNSPAHRATLLGADFRHIGVGFHRGTPFKSKRSAATYTVDLARK